MKRQYGQFKREDDIDLELLAIHMEAIQREGLVGRHVVAKELAWRDQQIAELNETVTSAATTMDCLRHQIEELSRELETTKAMASKPGPAK